MVGEKEDWKEGRLEGWLQGRLERLKNKEGCEIKEERAIDGR
jgi:hypothetical protein